MAPSWHQYGTGADEGNSNGFLFRGPGIRPRRGPPARRFFSARSAARSASRWPTGFSPRAILALYERFRATSTTLRSGNLPSASRPMRPLIRPSHTKLFAPLLVTRSAKPVISSSRRKSWPLPAGRVRSTRLLVRCASRRYVGSVGGEVNGEAVRGRSTGYRKSRCHAVFRRLAEMVAFHCRPPSLTLDQGVIRQVESERSAKRARSQSRRRIGVPARHCF
jgi:hypothetical protein